MAAEERLVFVGHSVVVDETEAFVLRRGVSITRRPKADVVPIVGDSFS